METYGACHFMNSMYEELKYLAKNSYHTGGTGNYLLLLINRKDKRLNLSFKKKPPSHIRNHLRIIGFSWSRKNKYWRSYLNKTQIKRVRKFYRRIN